MAQMSIYTKIRHHSVKDVTASIGKNEQVYITFRNGSHRKITKTDYIDVAGHNGRVMFVEGRPGKGYKLATNKEGRTPNYYIKFSGPANLKVYNIIRRSLGEDGSVSFDLDELEVEYMTDREPLEEPKTMTGEEVAIKSLTMRVEALEKCVANLIEKKTAAPDDWKAKLIETINSL